MQPKIVAGHKGKEHFDAFLADLQGLTDKFTRSRSSVAGLLSFLEKNKAQPLPFSGDDTDAKLTEAVKKCSNPNDSRITKYRPAIKRLAKVWGTNADYPKADTTAPVVRSTSRGGDLAIAQKVCDELSDIKVADVDFSENVRKAAKAKMIRGRSLYDIVKAEWEKSPGFREHDLALTTAKGNAKVEGGTVSLKSLQKVASIVRQYGYGVCESLTATVIAECKTKGFGGRMEWVGIHYPTMVSVKPKNPTDPPKPPRKMFISGHSIVVAHRQGDISDVKTWGDYFVLDMWYYNLGMRKGYLYATAQDRSAYYKSDFERYTERPWEVMADIT